jgi:N-hydroxyarylamine O-acetyltransferase
MRDFSAYLQRIGFIGTPRADMATLQQLVLRQALAIPFENLDAFTGRGVSLVSTDVEAKLVGGQRGGWCFEHNLLLGNALRLLGFSVQDLAGRVLWGRAANELTARTHRLLRVEHGGRHYLLDAGFGVLTPTAPLDFSSREPQATPHERFRLRELETDLLLEAELRDATGTIFWTPLYRFDLHPHWPIDFEAANFQLARDPASQFVAGLRVAQPRPDGRYTLRDREFTWRDLAGHVETRRLADAAQLRSVLLETFGIETRDIDGLDERFARLA